MKLWVLVFPRVRERAEGGSLCVRVLSLISFESRAAKKWISSCGSLGHGADRPIRAGIDRIDGLIDQNCSCCGGESRTEHLCDLWPPPPPRTSVHWPISSSHVSSWCSLWVRCWDEPVRPLVWVLRGSLHVPEGSSLFELFINMDGVRWSPLTCTAPWWLAAVWLINCSFRLDQLILFSLITLNIREETRSK